MAVAAPSDEVIRLVEALGLRTKNTREVTLRMAVNEVVAVNTVEYVNGEQIDALASEFKERQYRLARWIPVEERLPEPGETVLVWHHGEAQMAWLNHFTNGVAYFVRDTHYNFEPTHWMPLPESPMCATH